VHARGTLAYQSQVLDWSNLLVLLGAIRASVNLLLSAESALGGLGDWVPAGFRHPWRLAALAAWRKARVSTAAAAIPFARESVPHDILAANIIFAHADIATAAVAMGALELVAIAVPALNRGLSALRLFANGVPCTPRALRPAALAAWCIACVSTAATTLPMAWKAVPVDILAADIMLAHTGTTAAPVSASTFELGSIVVPALHRRLATPRGRILRTAHRQERVLFATTLASIGALRLAPHNRCTAHEKGKRHDGCVCHFKCKGRRRSQNELVSP